MKNMNINFEIYGGESGLEAVNQIIVKLGNAFQTK